MTKKEVLEKKTNNELSAKKDKKNLKKGERNVNER